jgi:hypothetical protein
MKRLNVVSGRSEAEKIGGMNGERAAALVRRRKALGFYTRNAFVSASGLGRDAVKSAELGTARGDTYERIEAWLDAAEAERGIKPPAPREPQDADSESGLVTFQLRGNFGVDVTVKGPVANLDELEEHVERLLARMERGQDET